MNKNIYNYKTYTIIIIIHTYIRTHTIYKKIISFHSFFPFVEIKEFN